MENLLLVRRLGRRFLCCRYRALRFGGLSYSNSGSCLPCFDFWTCRPGIHRGAELREGLKNPTGTLLSGRPWLASLNVARRAGATLLSLTRVLGARVPAPPTETMPVGVALLL